MTQRDTAPLAALTSETPAPLHHVGVRAGVDRIELADFARILSIGGDDFLASAYTDRERCYCRGRVDRLATRFAAKEATSKVLGTGFRGLGPSEIEIVSSANGQPVVQLRDRAHALAETLVIKSMSVSLTHTATMAEAFVVAFTAGPAATSINSRKENTT